MDAAELEELPELPLAALVPTVAALGSLYFSEYGNLWQPCRFCWFQRIFMYSSAVVLLLAAVRRELPEAREPDQRQRDARAPRRDGVRQKIQRRREHAAAA